MSATKRVRSANFSSHDKNRLVDLVVQIVFKEYNSYAEKMGHSVKAKEAAWRKVEENYNQVTDTERSIVSLKKLWDNLKRDAKNLRSLMKVQKDLKEDPVLLKVESALKLAVPRTPLNSEEHFLKDLEENDKEDKLNEISLEDCNWLKVKTETMSSQNDALATEFGNRKTIAEYIESNTVIEYIDPEYNEVVSPATDEKNPISEKNTRYRPRRDSYKPSLRSREHKLRVVRERTEQKIRSEHLARIREENKIHLDFLRKQKAIELEILELEKATKREMWKQVKDGKNLCNCKRKFQDSGD